jgi:hypothetical protein
MATGQICQTRGTYSNSLAATLAYEKSHPRPHPSSFERVSGYRGFKQNGDEFDHKATTD